MNFFTVNEEKSDNGTTVTLIPYEQVYRVEIKVSRDCDTLAKPCTWLCSHYSVYTLYYNAGNGQSKVMVFNEVDDKISNDELERYLKRNV